MFSIGWLFGDASLSEEEFNFEQFQTGTDAEDCNYVGNSEPGDLGLAPLGGAPWSQVTIHHSSWLVFLFDRCLFNLSVCVP